MDRRRFISTLSVFGGSAAISTSALGASEAAPFAPGSAPFNDGSEMAVATALHTWNGPKFGIVAIGAAGGMILTRLKGKLPNLYRSVAIGTEPLQLRRTSADWKILVEDSTSRHIERRSAGLLAIAADDEIRSAIAGLDQVFILTDLGLVIEIELATAVAESAREAQIMTIGAVVSPSPVDKCTQQVVQAGINRLTQRSVPIVPLSSEIFGGVARGVASWSGAVQTAATTAFERLYRSIVTIQEVPGQSLISVDREDIQGALSQNKESAMVVGYGSASGAESSQLSAYRAITHPLFALDSGLARLGSGILVSIEARPDILRFREINEVLRVVQQVFPDSLLIFGAFGNRKLVDDFQVTVLAPGKPWTQSSLLAVSG